jgi:hypothetical protein
MAATILNGPKAIEMSVFVVRAFVRLRELAATHTFLAAKLGELEKNTVAVNWLQVNLSRPDSFNT